HRHPCSEDGKFTVGDGGDVTHTAVQDHPGHTAGSGRHGQDLVDVAVLGLAGHVDHERRSEGSLGHAHVQGEVVPGGATHGVGGRGEGRSRPEGEQMCPERPTAASCKCHCAHSGERIRKRHVSLPLHPHTYERLAPALPYSPVT